MVKVVLAVVADAAVYRQLRDALRPDGITLYLAQTETSALRQVAQVHPEVILVCKRLFRGSGRDLCYRLRARSDLPLVPVLLLTDQDDPEQFPLGVIDYINIHRGDSAIRSQVRLAAQKRFYLELTANMRMADRLTGLWSANFFKQQLASQQDCYERIGQPYAVILADIDGLRAINRHHGETTGDRLLRHVGNALRSHARDHEPPCRVTGDCFGLVLKGIGKETAEQVAMRLEEAVLAVGDRFGLPLGVTFGVSAVDHVPPAKRSAEGVLHEAIRALRLSAPIWHGTPAENELQENRF